MLWCSTCPRYVISVLAPCVSEVRMKSVLNSIGVRGVDSSIINTARLCRLDHTRMGFVRPSPAGVRTTLTVYSRQRSVLLLTSVRVSTDRNHMQQENLSCDQGRTPQAGCRWWGKSETGFQARFSHGCDSQWGKLLRSSSSSSCCGINIYYQNGRGLRTKSHLFMPNILSVTCDIVILTETGLSSDIFSVELFSSCFSVFRCDRNFDRVHRRVGEGVLGVHSTSVSCSSIHLSVYDPCCCPSYWCCGMWFRPWSILGDGVVGLYYSKNFT